MDAEADSGLQNRVDPVVAVPCTAASERLEFLVKETKVEMVRFTTRQVVVVVL